MQQEAEITIRALKNTGLFEDPESDLRDIFSLKTTGKEAFLLGCYGAFPTWGHAYYLYDKEVFLSPPSESDILTLPPIPLRQISVNDIPGGRTFSALDLLRKTPRLLNRILQETKYVVLKDSDRWMNAIMTSRFYDPWYYYEYYNRWKDHFDHQYREEITNLREEVIRRGIDPVNVLVIDGSINKKTEGFLTPYLVGVKLRQEKYLISESSLGTWAGGDLFAYRAKDFGRGAFMAGLVIGIEEIETGESEPSACIIDDEAQTRITHSRHGISQVSGYVAASDGYFGKGFVVAPLADESQILEAEKQGVGIITFDGNGNLIFKDAKGQPSDKQVELTEEVKTIAHLAKECFDFLRQRLES